MNEFPAFLTDLPELELPFDGATGHLLQGEGHQVAFLGFHRDTVVPAHRHRAQWELVVSGEVRLRTPDGERTYTAGQSFFIPEGVEHGAVISAGYRAVVFFDQVDRYRAKT